jgi:glutathione S-transferase
METSAQLLYLLNKLDKDNHFGFKDELDQSELVQWLFFWHGSGAPYQGNLGFFRRAQEQSPCKFPPIPPSSRPSEMMSTVLIQYPQLVAINRFRKETYRVLGVLELQLSGKYTGQPKDFLAGKGKGIYTVADIGTWAWVKNWPTSGYTAEEMKEFPHLLKWIERIAERPAVQRGIGGKYLLS